MSKRLTVIQRKFLSWTALIVKTISTSTQSFLTKRVFIVLFQASMNRKIYLIFFLLALSLTSLQAVEFNESKRGGEQGVDEFSLIEPERRMEEPLAADDSSQLIQRGSTIGRIAEEPKNDTQPSEGNNFLKSSKVSWSFLDLARVALITFLNASVPPAHAGAIFPINGTAVLDATRCFFARQKQLMNEDFCKYAIIPKEEDCDVNNSRNKNTFLEERSSLANYLGYFGYSCFFLNRKLSCEAAKAYDCFFWKKKERLEDTIQDNYPLFKAKKDSLGRRAELGFQEGVECRQGEEHGMICTGDPSWKVSKRNQIRSASHDELEQLYRDKISNSPDTPDCIKARWAEKADHQLEQKHLTNLEIFRMEHTYFENLIKPDEIKSRIAELMSLVQENASEIESDPSCQKLLEDEKNIKTDQELMTGWQQAVEDYESFMIQRYKLGVSHQEKIHERYKIIYYDQIASFKNSDEELLGKIEEIKKLVCPAEGDETSLPPATVLNPHQSIILNPRNITVESGLNGLQ